MTLTEVDVTLNPVPPEIASSVQKSEIKQSELPRTMLVLKPLTHTSFTKVPLARTLMPMLAAPAPPTATIIPRPLIIVGGPPAPVHLSTPSRLNELGMLSCVAHLPAPLTLTPLGMMICPVMR